MANLAVRAGVFTALAALACARYSGAAALQLTTNGASGYRIVVPDAPMPSERFAAAELQKYLALISGAKIEVQAPGEEVGRKIIVAVVGRAKQAAKVEFAKGDADLDASAIETDGGDLRGAEAAARRDKGLADCQQFLDEARASADTDRSTQLIAEEQALFEAYRKFQFTK